MKIVDFFGRLFRLGDNPESSTNLEELFQDSQSIYLKKLAIDKSAEFLARIFSDSEFRFQNSEDKRWTYLLNVKPNSNDNASIFWQRAIYKLITQNEVLIILSDDNQLLIADSFYRREYALYEDVFENVTVKNYSFKKKFKMNEVIFLQYNNNRLSTYIEGLFSDYEKLHSRLVEAISRNNQIRGTLGVKGTQRMDDKQLKLLQDYTQKLFNAFSERSVAIVPMKDSIEYNELTNTVGTGNLSVEDIKHLRRQFDDEIADILGIPPTILHGDMATLDSSQKALVLYVMKPLFRKVENELNAKIIEQSKYEKGGKIKIIGISHRDIFDLATSIDKLISSASFNRNEVREELGYQSIEGGDTFIMTKNYQEGWKGGDKEDDTNSD